MLALCSEDTRETNRNHRLLWITCSTVKGKPVCLDSATAWGKFIKIPRRLRGPGASTACGQCPQLARSHNSCRFWVFNWMPLLSHPEHYNSNILARFLRSLFPGSRRISPWKLAATQHTPVSSICDIFPFPNSSGRAFLLILPDLYAVFMTLTSSALCDIRVTLVLPHLCPLRHCQIHALLSRAFPFPPGHAIHTYGFYI